jgi:bifunctional DNA-binding transcriptional regulator/antitoxin component of YhaV-PrlF toxin-antitoxin module
MTKHKKDGVRYEIITQEDTETGDILVPLPPQLLEELNWKEGDIVDFSLDDQNRYIIKKVVK